MTRSNDAVAGRVAYCTGRGLRPAPGGVAWRWVTSVTLGLTEPQLTTATGACPPAVKDAAAADLYALAMGAHIALTQYGDGLCALFFSGDGRASTAVAAAVAGTDDGGDAVLCRLRQRAVRECPRVLAQAMGMAYEERRRLRL